MLLEFLQSTIGSREKCPSIKVTVFMTIPSLFKTSSKFHKKEKKIKKKGGQKNHNQKKVEKLRHRDKRSILLTAAVFL